MRAIQVCRSAKMSGKYFQGNLIIIVLLRQLIDRGVAQLASVLAWGASGRQFESDHSDLGTLIIK